jgi:chromosome partitioning protein
VLDPASLDETPATPRADDDPLPWVSTRIPRLDLVVANKALALYAGFDGDDDDPTDRLRRHLARSPRARGYDFLLMDAPPSFGPLTLNVLRAADEVVIPVPLTYLGLDGCAELVRSLQSVRTRFGRAGLRIAMVIPTFYRRTRLAHEVLDALKAQFPKELCHTVLGHHVRIDEAQSRGLSIFEYAPRDRGAKVMAELAEELEQRGEPPALEESA